MNQDRRSILTALGLGLPLGFLPSLRASRPAAVAPPALKFRQFEEAVRQAFRDLGVSAAGEVCRRVEVGHSAEVQAGLQGCVNARPFAGFPAGALRIVRAGSEPGPVVKGVRLVVNTVDVVLANGLPHATPGRPLDFAALPGAPVLG